MLSLLSRDACRVQAAAETCGPKLTTSADTT